MVAVRPKKPNGIWRNSDLGVIGISVGQSYHEADKLAATIDFSRRHFKQQQILVADTLQRWTLQTQFITSREAAYQHANAMGDAWLARHAAAIKGIPVIRWDDYKAAHHYRTTLFILYGLIKTDIHLAQAVRSEAMHYTERRAKAGWQVSYKTLRASFFYILEELAADCAAAATAPRTIIYPYAEPRSYRALRREKHPVTAALQQLHWCHARLSHDG